jgi:hypothetical protein
MSHWFGRASSRRSSADGFLPVEPSNGMPAALQAAAEIQRQKKNAMHSMPSDGRGAEGANADR